MPVRVPVRVPPPVRMRVPVRVPPPVRMRVPVRVRVPTPMPWPAPTPRAPLPRRVRVQVRMRVPVQVPVPVQVQARVRVRAGAAAAGAGAAGGADALAAAAALAGAAAGPDTAAGSRYLPLIAAARGRGLRSALGTVYRSANTAEVGARLALVEQATGAEEHATSPQPHTFGHLRPSVREALARDLAALLRGGRSHSAEYQIEGAPVQVLLELIEPPLALTVCGAGPDAQPLVTLAANLGWAPVVFDHRAGFARPERFPDALRVVSAPREEFSRAVPPRPGEVVVLMTHSYPTDLTYLEQLAARSVRYIGVLGPRRRLQRLLDELGPRAPAANVVYGPAGLDIGADSPPEIALSIVAEIRAVLAERSGSPLHRRPTPIHTAVTAGR